MKHGNPQGKGLVPSLQAWRDTCPAKAAPRSAHTLLADYCASSLVLAARFDFSPVPGNSYHLYHCGYEWRLSLISPEEWGVRRPGVHVARCDLRDDMTWFLAAAGDLAAYPRVIQALEQHMEGFIDALDSDIPLVDNLPFHVAELPFYRRLFASALARSLRNTLEQGNLTRASGRKLLDASEGSTRLLQLLPSSRCSSET
ncbi:MAG: DUF2452 domain-containing protein [Chromatocurvus sp.]